MCYFACKQSHNMQIHCSQVFEFQNVLERIISESWYTLEPCYSKWGPQTRSRSVTRELIGNAESQAPVQLQMTHIHNQV